MIRENTETGYSGRTFGRGARFGTSHYGLMHGLDDSNPGLQGDGLPIRNLQTRSLCWTAARDNEDVERDLLSSYREIFRGEDEWEPVGCGENFP